MANPRKTAGRIKTKDTRRKNSTDLVIVFLISFAVHTVLNILVNKARRS